ncbi:hypothetical protein [[Phormidium ambiguum] IAM M-71]|nr:hypothetical protein [Phormidium ambiguum]
MLLRFRALTLGEERREYNNVPNRWINYITTNLRYLVYDYSAKEILIAAN